MVWVGRAIFAFNLVSTLKIKIKLASDRGRFMDSFLLVCVG